MIHSIHIVCVFLNEKNLAEVIFYIHTYVCISTIHFSAITECLSWFDEHCLSSERIHLLGALLTPIAYRRRR